jgi:uncharacterized protein (TIGR02145 family)
MTRSIFGRATSKLLLVGVAFAAIAGCESSTSSDSGTMASNSGTVVDGRDGQSYPWVKIGSQTWMARNLDYIGSATTLGQCYLNSPDSCHKYGRLYYWAEAMGASLTNDSSVLGASLPVRGICPVGWHLPSMPEWKKLSDTILDPRRAGVVLKSTSWTGSDSTGFHGLPVGDCYLLNTGVECSTGGQQTAFWSSTEYNANSAWNAVLVDSTLYPAGADSLGEYTYPYIYKRYAYSVRCLKD